MYKLGSLVILVSVLFLLSGVILIQAESTPIISQEAVDQSFNCVLGSCSVAQQIVPQTTFNATKVGFRFGGTGGGTATTI